MVRVVVGNEQRMVSERTARIIRWLMEQSERLSTTLQRESGLTSSGKSNRRHVSRAEFERSSPGHLSSESYAAAA